MAEPLDMAGSGLWPEGIAYEARIEKKRMDRLTMKEKLEEYFIE